MTDRDNQLQIKKSDPKYNEYLEKMLKNSKGFMKDDECIPGSKEIED